MTKTDVYSTNSAGMWASLGQLVPGPQGVLAVRTSGSIRFLALRQLSGASLTALIAAPGLTGRTVIEDPFGAPDVATPVDTTVLRMPVMIRPPAPVTQMDPDGVSVVPCSTCQVWSRLNRSS
ncbi:hypothetical protein ACQEUX_25490 [Micromonospora sp. CA-259024]|uniref:hypothetical protein n=1 Tax=Micromonospora sp. CA-259024 TaxID=3239965 RepID=UPI003D948E6B